MTRAAIELILRERAALTDPSPDPVLAAVETAVLLEDLLPLQLTDTEILDPRLTDPSWLATRLSAGPS